MVLVTRYFLMVLGARWSQTDKRNVLAAAKYFCDLYRDVRGKNNKPTLRLFCVFVTTHDSLENTGGLHLPIVEDKRNWNANTLREKAKKDWFKPSSDDYPFSHSEDHLSEKDRIALGLVKNLFEKSLRLPLPFLLDIASDSESDREDVEELTRQKFMATARASLGADLGREDQQTPLYPIAEAAHEKALSLSPAKLIAKPSPRTRHERSAAGVGLLNHLQTAVEHQELLAAVDPLPRLKPVTPVSALDAEARARSATPVKVSEDAGRLMLQKYENRPFRIRDEAGELISEKTLDHHIEPLYEANLEFFSQIALLSIPLEVHRHGNYVIFRLYDSPNFFARHFIDTKSLRRLDGCFCGAVERRVPSICMQKAGNDCLKDADFARLEAEKLHIQRMGPNSGPVVEALFIPTKVFPNTVSSARLEFIIPWQSRFERRVDYHCQAIYNKKENTIRYSDYLFTCASQETVDIDELMPQ